MHTDLLILFMTALCFASCFLIYRHFYRREDRLISQLLQMIDQVQDGTFQRNEISEDKISALENRLKKYMDDSLLEQEHQKQQKELIQELISDISHQTLTPVANLKLYTELLKEAATVHSPPQQAAAGPPALDDIAEIAETIQEQIEKLEFHIQSLVKLSRMESGIVQLHPQQNEVSTLFHALHKEYREKAAFNQITLSFLETELRAKFDMKWTIEAIGNIIDNAIKYTPAGGSVSVRAQASSFFIKITIADTGIGIAPEEYHKIFSRFYRSFAVADRPGVGIGLYLAREFVQSQKGYLKVTSQIGRGSVFSVFLPI